MSDTVANFLTMIRNAQMAHKESVKVPYANFTLRVAEILARLGYVARAEKSGKTGKRYIDVTIAYDEDGEGKIKMVRRISKPGQRLYADARKLKPVAGVTIIVSTPKGVMTGSEARRAKLGGEIICEVR